MAINPVDPQQKKNSIIKEIIGSGNVGTIRLFTDLLDAVIEEARVKNDDAKGDDFLLNQGEIQNCKKLKSYLTFKA